MSQHKAQVRSAKSEIWGLTSLERGRSLIDGATDSSINIGLDVFRDFYKQKLGQKIGSYAGREFLEVPIGLTLVLGILQRGEPLAFEGKNSRLP